ncbi:MAG: polysaccharide pyruvyl transferase family protein [Elainella sp.]
MTDSSKAWPLISDDYFWDDALAFLQKQSSPNQNFLLPEELCSAFPQAFSYQQIQAEQRSEFDWALLHKGRLSCIPVNILDRICRSRHPVFANEVFVLFASPQISGNPPPLLIHSPHVKALFSQLRQRKLQQSLQVLSLAAKTTDRPSPLIERPKRKILNRSAFIPLAWAATSNHHPYANLGDALSPILVSALSGLPIVHRNFESSQRRLACVGTIAHGFKHGAVHVWGTGLDPKKNPVDPDLPRYQRPAKTNFHVHAVRGLYTAQVLRSQGIEVPPIYGDPVWFLPSIIEPAAEKRYELGVVVHLTELAERTTTAAVNPGFLRYQIPPALRDQIRIITTLTEPSFVALEARVQEITACKRIVSTSLHGLVIGETYGIPSVPLRIAGRGTAFVQLDNLQDRLDRRVRDFYSGVGVEKLFVYGQRRHEPMDWEQLIDAIDRYWSPLTWSPEQFLDAFPLPLAFNPLQNRPFENRTLLEQIKL